MRTLFVSGSFMGHVNTLMPLALAARDAGHEVVFATGPDLVAEVQSRGLSTWSVGLPHATMCAGRIPPSWLAYFEAAAGHRLHELLALALAWRPELVIHEETELAGPIVAALTGSKAVIHGLSVMPSAQLRTLLFEAVQRLVDGMGSTHDMATLMARSTYLDVCPPLLQSTNEGAWQHVMPIRPAMGTAGAGERLPASLDAMPFGETLHLTLGTVFNDHVHVLESAILALRDLDYNLVVTIGRGRDPATFGPQPPHVVLTPYLAHELLLPRCRLVVSQGGAGVLFGGLAHGLPQLVLPQGADQFTNAQACVRAGAGLALVGEEVTAPAVQAAVLRLMDEPSFSQHAQAVAREIRSMPDAAQVIGKLCAVSS